MANDQASLLSLPVEIIQIISQYLIDSEDASCYFGCGLKDLMHLRITCSHLNSVVLNLPIGLKLVLPSVHISTLYATEDTSLETLAEFIVYYTAWKISTLILTDSFLEDFPRNNIKQPMKAFKPLRSICSHSVRNLIFTCADNVQQVEEVVNFFNEFALSNRTIVSIRYYFDTDISVTDNLGHPTCRGYIRDLTLTSYNENDPVASVLENCLNIETLEINCRVSFSLSLLAAFRHLNCLKLTNIGLVIDESESNGVCLENVRSLVMVLEHFLRNKEKSGLSNNFIVKHFPSLKSFRLLSRSRKSTVGSKGGIAICLPKSCESLFVSYQESLNYFANSSIRNLGLSYTNIGNIKSLRTQFLQSLCHVAVETVCCSSFVDVLESIKEHLLSMQDIQFISIGNFTGIGANTSHKSLEAAKNMRYNSTVQDWFQQRKTVFQSHNSLKYIVLGNCLMSFKCSVVSSKDWISLKELDRYHQGSMKLIPDNAVVMDMSQ